MRSALFPEGEMEEDRISQDSMEPKWVETSDGQIEVEDPDDYLIYLEDILKRIHEYVLLLILLLSISTCYRSL